MRQGKKELDEYRISDSCPSIATVTLTYFQKGHDPLHFTQRLSLSSTALGYTHFTDLVLPVSFASLEDKLHIGIFDSSDCSQAVLP